MAGAAVSKQVLMQVAFALTSPATLTHDADALPMNPSRLPHL